MDVYGYLDGQVLYDPLGRLAALTRIARERFGSYRVSPEERQRLAYWLTTAREKIAGAIDSKDFQKAALVATTSSWQILEALWAINDRPMPPIGAVLPHLQHLTTTPDNLGELLHQFLLGGLDERVGAAVTLIDWTSGRLVRRR